MNGRSHVLLTIGLACGACGPTPDNTQPPDANWAMDAFHLFTETHGETTQFIIDKIELFPGGATTQTTVQCAGVDDVFAGTWRSTEEGVLVEPPGDADVVFFGQSQYSKLVLTQLTSCDAVQIRGFSPSGTDLGTMSLTRGDLCLSCDSLDYDQLVCCDSMQPMSICCNGSR
jgi:hypothetical protein